MSRSSVGVLCLRALARCAGAPAPGSHTVRRCTAGPCVTLCLSSLSTQSRWASTGGSPPSVLSGAFPAATASTAAPAAPGDNDTPAPSTSATPQQEMQEKLKQLSPEDQQLIMEALARPADQKPSTMGGAGIGPRDADMVAAFTCGRCDYRMVKKFSKHAYTKGIVIVECPNCRVKHLLADNLGWIEDEARNIEDILREKGERFVRVGDGDYQVEGPRDGTSGSS